MVHSLAHRHRQRPGHGGANTSTTAVVPSTIPATDSPSPAPPGPRRRSVRDTSGAHTTACTRPPPRRRHHTTTARTPTPPCVRLLCPRHHHSLRHSLHQAHHRGGYGHSSVLWHCTGLWHHHRPQRRAVDTASVREPDHAVQHVCRRARHRCGDVGGLWWCRGCVVVWVSHRGGVCQHPVSCPSPRRRPAAYAATARRCCCVRYPRGVCGRDFEGVCGCGFAPATCTVPNRAADAAKPCSNMMLSVPKTLFQHDDQSRQNPVPTSTSRWV